MVPDGGAEFLFPIVVHRDGAAAEVDPRPGIGIAHIGQVADLGTVPYGGVFQFHKIPHLDPLTDAAVGADVGEGADGGVVVHGGFIELGGIHHHPVPDDTVPDHGIGSDLAVFSDNGFSPQDGAGQQHRTRSHRDGRPHKGGGRVHHPHPRGKEPLQAEAPGQRFHRGGPVGQIGLQGKDAALEGLCIPQSGQSLVKAAAILQSGGQSGPLQGKDALAHLPGGQVKLGPLRGQQHRPGHHGHLTGHRGQKLRQPGGSVGGAGGDKEGIRREAVPGKIPVSVVTDHQKPLYPFGFQSVGQPEGGGVKEDLLQKQGGSLLVGREEYNGTQSLHERPSNHLILHPL